MSKAVNYNNITGSANIGDKVVLNTTALELKLGTGGYHFVIYNSSNIIKNMPNDPGHIMKLRYTPFQLKVLSAEEQESPYHEAFKSFKSLESSLYIVGTLHSMLAPIIASLKYIEPNLKITYIMTDAGALPLSFSQTVKKLKELKLLDTTITVGHAFGGDIECVNIYTGIIAAKLVAKSDITIITMGPGIVGTGTQYGFSGIEQASIIDAVNKLGGISIAIPRISFSDTRDRHKGISHHTLTILENIACTRTNVVFPILKKEYEKLISLQLEKSNINKKHNIIYENGSEVLNALNYFSLNVKTMGRSYHDDEAFFLTMGAVAKAGIKFLENDQ
ncbi:DUF3866 family protein [Proteiniborus ethanoligenes]|nr:DUF3866 family protein [Proteiniborus ethanoligenes]